MRGVGGDADVERAGPGARALARCVHGVEGLARGGVGERVGERRDERAHGGAIEAAGGDAQAVQGALNLAHDAGQGGPLRRAGRAGDRQQEAVRRDVLAAQVVLPPGAQTPRQVPERGRGWVYVGEGARHGGFGGGRRGEHGELDRVEDRGREGAGHAVGERVEQLAGQAEQLQAVEFEPDARVLALLGAGPVVRDRDTLLCGARGMPRCLRMRVRAWRLDPPEQRPPCAALRARLCRPTHEPPPPPASPRRPSGRRGGRRGCGRPCPPCGPRRPRPARGGAGARPRGSGRRTRRSPHR